MFSADFNVNGSTNNNYYGNNNNVGFSIGMGNLFGTTTYGTTTTTTYGNTRGGASVSIGLGAPAVAVGISGPALSVSMSFDTPDKQGNLRKFAVGRSFGGAKNWKERYFATKGASLSYAFMIGSEPMRAPCQLCERSQLLTRPTLNDHPAATNPETMFLLTFYECGTERKLLMEAANPILKNEWVACLAARVGWVDRQRSKRPTPAVVVPPPMPVVVSSPKVTVGTGNNVSLNVDANALAAATMTTAGAATVAAAGMMGAGMMCAVPGASVSFEASAGPGTTTTYYGNNNMDVVVSGGNEMIVAGGGMSCDMMVSGCATGYQSTTTSYSNGMTTSTYGSSNGTMYGGADVSMTVNANDGMGFGGGMGYGAGADVSMTVNANDGMGFGGGMNADISVSAQGNNW